MPTEPADLPEQTAAIHDEAVRSRTVHRRPDAAALRRASSPVRVFTDAFIASKIWFGLALLAVTVALVEPILIINTMKKEERVIALDSLGTVYVSPLQDFANATELHESQIKLAVSALLDRNPAGPDNPELLKKLYLKDAYEEAENMVEREEQEFKGKGLHQKAEITGIEILGTRENFVLGRAVGQMIRSGTFNGASFTEALNFEMSFTLARNPDIRMNGRFPTAVYAFKFATTPR